MKHGQLWIFLLMLCLVPPAIAAEYQGTNLDGRRFAGQVYAYETGGVFDAEVEFQGKRAILYFVNGGRQVVRLKRKEIKDPHNIVAWSRGLVDIAGVLSIGLAKNSQSSNLEPPRPFAGLWRIRLKEADLVPPIEAHNGSNQQQ